MTTSHHHRHTHRLYRLILTVVTIATAPCWAQSGNDTLSVDVSMAPSMPSPLPSDAPSIDPTSSLDMMPNMSSSTMMMMMPMNMSDIPENSTIMMTSTVTTFVIPTPTPSLNVSMTPTISPTSSLTPTSTLTTSTITITVEPTISDITMVSTRVSIPYVTSMVSSTPLKPTDPPTTDSEPVVSTEAIIGIAAGGGILLAVIVVALLIFMCYCCRKTSHSASYDTNQHRPVYVVRRWDERTEHAPNRGGSFRGSKGSFARSSIRSSISSIASFMRVGSRRSRNNSLSRNGGETIPNTAVLKVTPL